MRFSVIYESKKEVRDNVIALLLSAISQGHNLSQTKANHPLFVTKPYWPSQSELYNLPMSHQCEEFEFLNGSLNTLRTNTIDVEVIVKTDTVPPVNENPQQTSE